MNNTLSSASLHRGVLTKRWEQPATVNVKPAFQSGAPVLMAAAIFVFASYWKTGLLCDELPFLVMCWMKSDILLPPQTHE